MYTLIYIAVLTGTILALAKLSPAVLVRSTGSAVGVAVVFSLLNWAVGWLIAWLVKVIIFIPALLTFGLLFLFVPLLVNAVLLWVTDKLMESFELRGAKALWTSALVITLVNFVLELATRTHDVAATQTIWSLGAPHPREAGVLPDGAYLRVGGVAEHEIMRLPLRARAAA